MALTKRDILAARPKVRAVEVPEWGGAVHLRPMNVRQVMDFMKAREQLDPAELYPLLVQLSACDDEGSPLFGPEDLDLLKAQPFALLRRVGDEALSLNGMGRGDDEAAAKNS